MWQHYSVHKQKILYNDKIILEEENSSKAFVISLLHCKNSKNTDKKIIILNLN